MSVECFVGDHLGAAYLAAAVLVGYGLGLPLFLIMKVRGPAGVYPLCKIVYSRTTISCAPEKLPIEPGLPGQVRKVIAATEAHPAGEIPPPTCWDILFKVP